MTNPDISALPFDSEAMLAGLRPWVECESPSWDGAAVNRMLDLAARDFLAAGAELERIPGSAGFGDFLRLSLWPTKPALPGILIIGHFDTVHPVGTLSRFPWRREAGRCFGPGILDMKAGNYLILEAFRQLKAAGIQAPLPVTVLFTSDEEVGSPTSRAIIESEAGRNRYVLIPEPARPDGSVVTGRYAICRIQIEAVGRPTHAGNGFQNGISAIREMAELIPAVEDLSSEEATCSIGIMRGGEFSNCVASICNAEGLIMARSADALDRLWARLRTLKPKRKGAAIAFERGLERPIWQNGDIESLLFTHARQIAASLGIELRGTTSGGGSDGNFTGALGIETLDGLGVRGASLHTLDEHIFVDSLAERARLFAGLLATLGTSG